MKILDIRKIRDELLDSINGAYTNNKYFFVFIQENNEIGKRYFNTLKKLSKKYNVNIVGFFYKNRDQLYSYVENYVNQVAFDSDKISYLFVEPVSRDIKAKEIKIDGFNVDDNNMIIGKSYWLSNYLYAPCTSVAVMHTLDKYIGNLTGKVITVIGRSKTVGAPIAKMCLDNDATVIQCHSKTKNLKQFTTQSDIIIAATNIPHLLKSDMITDNTTIIDVGFEMVDGVPCGNLLIDDKLKNKNITITSVPNGIGLLTPVIAIYKAIY